MASAYSVYEKNCLVPKEQSHNGQLLIITKRSNDTHTKKIFISRSELRGHVPYEVEYFYALPKREGGGGNL